jgi:hypothetical protein
MCEAIEHGQVLASVDGQSVTIHSSPRAFFCSSVMRAQVLMNVLAMVSPCEQQIRTPPPPRTGEARLYLVCTMFLPVHSGV